QLELQKGGLAEAVPGQEPTAAVGVGENWEDHVAADGRPRPVPAGPPASAWVIPAWEGNGLATAGPIPGRVGKKIRPCRKKGSDARRAKKPPPVPCRRF